MLPPLPHCTQHQLRPRSAPLHPGPVAPPAPLYPAPTAPPQRLLRPTPSLAMLEFKRVSLTLQTTWPRCRPVDTFQLLSQSTKYPHRWLLVTWVCGFSIKDSIHPDRFLRRRDCFRHNGWTSLGKATHPQGCVPCSLLLSLFYLFYFILFIYHFFPQTRLSPA